MTTLDIGRVCVKLTGREAGKRCIIVDRIDKNFVLVRLAKKAKALPIPVDNPAKSVNPKAKRTISNSIITPLIV